MCDVWQMVVAVAICMHCIVTFLTMTLNSMTDSLLATGFVCDLIMILNIVSCFFVAYVDDRGFAHYKFRIIARKYVRGLFIVDLLALLPFDYVVDYAHAFTNHTRALSVLRLTRLIGLIRVSNYLSQ